jgi:hypothetical protein
MTTREKNAIELQRKQERISTWEHSGYVNNTNFTYGEDTNEYPSIEYEYIN